MRKNTKALDFAAAAKQSIAERDSIDGHPCCINCGTPAPVESPLSFSNAHFISRAQSGRGIPENGLTLCLRCHRQYDQSPHRPRMRTYFKEYLRRRYPGWDESKLIYEKEI